MDKRQKCSYPLQLGIWEDTYLVFIIGKNMLSLLWYIFLNLSPFFSFKNKITTYTRVWPAFLRAFPSNLFTRDIPWEVETSLRRAHCIPNSSGLPSPTNPRYTYTFVCRLENEVGFADWDDSFIWHWRKGGADEDSPARTVNRWCNSWASLLTQLLFSNTECWQPRDCLGLPLRFSSLFPPRPCTVGGSGRLCMPWF